MRMELTLFCRHIGDSELDSSEVRSTEWGPSSPSGSEFTRVGSGVGSTECGSAESGFNEFASTECESTELETVVSGRVEDLRLRQWWPMDDDRLLATLYGSRCVLTDELVPRNSFVIMKTHPVLVRLVDSLHSRARY